jgi:hypothetical protein
MRPDPNQYEDEYNRGSPVEAYDYPYSANNPSEQAADAEAMYRELRQKEE